MRKIEFKRLNILYVIDQWGWAYCYNAREQAQYSKHNILRKPLLEITEADLQNIDIVYFHGPNIWKPISDELIKTIRTKYKNIKIIGVYSVENELMYPDVDLVITTSSNFYQKCIEMYKGYNCHVIFMPKGIDSEFFVPSSKDRPIIFGWAGRKADDKRCHLLDLLNHQIKRQSYHNNKFFIKGRDRTPMLNFYHSLKCLVLTSVSEALPRTILEAMSCGIAVISTKVGSVPLLIDSKWVVPVNPEEKVIKEINKRLDIFSKNPNLCNEVGNRNRKFIETNWSWKILQPYWDLIFTEVYKNHNKSIKIYNDRLIKEKGII
jgi:hypothetical protein